MSPEDIQALAEACEDPVWFAENVLGEKIWSRQAEMLRAIANHERVTVRSGHKTSKTRNFAITALWWPFLWHLRGEDARVALTAASFDQVKKAVWREIKAMYRRSRPYQQVCVKKPSLDPTTGLTLASGGQVFGFSTTEAENAAGISSPHVMYLIDEASGVEDRVFEAMEGNMAGGAKMVMASQGTRMVGKFFDSFHSEAEFWHQIRLSSWDSPNITGEMEIPGLATKSWCEEKLKMWGESNPLYQVRVLGNFPGRSENTIISLPDAQNAVDRWDTCDDVGKLRLGVDVARFGDDETVIWPVRGLKAYDPIIMHSSDGVEVAGEIVRTVRKYKRETDKEIEVKIDEVGLGSSPIDSLNHMDRAKGLGIVVRSIHNQSNADDDDNYSDLGTQMAFHLADWLTEGKGAIPNDSKLIEEMVSTTYDIDNRGRMKIANKKAMKKLIRRSPDRRNALEMAVWDGQSKRTIGAARVNL